MKKKSRLTKLVFYLSWLSFIVSLFIGLPRLDSTNPAERDWALLAVQVAFGGIIGMYLSEIFLGNGMRLIPEFKSDNSKLFPRTIITFFLMFLIRMIAANVPISVRGWEVALAVMFAAPQEEMLFRALIMSIFIYLAARLRDKRGKKDILSLKIMLKESSDLVKRPLSGVELAGMLVSAIAFALFHENYYNNLSMMITVFLWGLVLAFLFWYWHDITPLVFAHFAVNAIWAILNLPETFWLVYF